jgi:ribose/xylose/arabinose/galactoside ABC-type transport system permease subunit
VAMQRNETETALRGTVDARPATRPIGNMIRKRLLSFVDGNEVFVVLLVMLLLAPNLTDKFATTLNIKNLLSQSSILGILSISQFLVVLIGGFDLSVAGILALSSVMIADVATKQGVEAAIVFALATGLGLGFVNGLAVTKGRVPPLIATFAMLGIARGLAFSITEKSLLVWGTALDNLDWEYGVLTTPTLLWFALTLLVFAFLSSTRIGIHIYAIGGNEVTARLAGVNVNWVRLGVYTVAGFLSAVGGLIFVMRSKSGVPHVGTGWELTTIAAVVIGGTQLAGGEGNLIKAMIGVIVYQMIGNVMNLMRLDPFYQDIVRAIVILIAVGFSMWRSARRARTT